jgi:ABC-type phosphate transport system substrate-binding protein
MVYQLSIVLLIGLVLLPVFAAEPAVTPESVVMIGHKAITDGLTRDSVKQIFLGRLTRWKDDTKITFVLLNEPKIYEAFLKAHVDKTIYQYTNYWKKQVFTGKGRMPKTFDTSAELIEFVAATEGAIGFVTAQETLPETVITFTITEK